MCFPGTCILMERYVLSAEKPLWKSKSKLSPYWDSTFVEQLCFVYTMPQQTKQLFPVQYRFLENTSKWPIKVPRKDVFQKQEWFTSGNTDLSAWRRSFFLSINLISDIEQVPISKTSEISYWKLWTLAFLNGWVCLTLKKYTLSGR